MKIPIKASKTNLSFIALVILSLLTIIFVLFYNRFSSLFIHPKELVEGYPTSPTYPDSSFVDSTKEPNAVGGDYSYHGTWETDDSVPTVMAWYLEKLQSEGWNMNVLPADPQAPDIQYAEGYKGEDIYNIIQVSVIRDKSTNKTKAIIEFPSKSSGYEDEEGEEE